MRSSYPDIKHLMLVGGGHAQVAVLKSLVMNPIFGLRTSLISRDVMTPYSGMLPGYLEGAYSAQDIGIDLSHLARQAAARFIHAPITAINPDRKTVSIKDRPEIGYDILSLNIGSAPDLSAINGAAEHAIAVKPISTLLNRIAPILENTAAVQSIAIIGGGAAGVEVALSLHHRLNNIDGRYIKFSLIHRGGRIMPEFPVKAARYLTREMKTKSIDLYCGSDVAEVTKNAAILRDGTSIAADLILVVTAGVAPDVIKSSGLSLDERGFIAVHPSLQSISHGDIFASGDVATVMAHPRPKAGVFAVRAGAILTDNLRHAIHGEALRQWQPQKHYLALIGTGGGKAMPVRGNIVLPPSKWAWRLKEWIDVKFIKKFTILPQMPEDAPSPLALAEKALAANLDPALMAMRCLGCGAKTGWSDLDTAIRNAADFLAAQNGELKPLGAIPIDTTHDSASFPPPASGKNGFSGNIVQSIDAISPLVDDAFLLGRIAALHALSDLFASHATPHSALAILTIPSALASLQKDDITQLLAGAMVAFSEHGAYLAGGHTAEARDAQIGFAVTGFALEGRGYTPKDGDAIILTKPIGIGMVMAAHRQAHPLATGAMRGDAIAVMTRSNGHAADVFRKFGRFPMTDVTGFGLGRHLLSLLSGLKTGSAMLKADALPVLDGAIQLAMDGVQSSLAGQNAISAPIKTNIAFPSALLHDPQTGGGLLAIVPQAKAKAILAALHKIGDTDAAIIGKFKQDGAQITLT
ncbi:MAG: selenide, water dikinase SelD [Candidatus Puniceispirillales bacterium WSBS_2018_MAG_OTU23]